MAVTLLEMTTPALGFNTLPQTISLIQYRVKSPMDSALVNLFAALIF